MTTTVDWNYSNHSYSIQPINVVNANTITTANTPYPISMAEPEVEIELSNEEWLDNRIEEVCAVA